MLGDVHCLDPFAQNDVIGGNPFDRQEHDSAAVQSLHPEEQINGVDYVAVAKKHSELAAGYDVRVFRGIAERISSTIRGKSWRF